MIDASSVLVVIAGVIGGGAAGAIINSVIAHRKAEQDKKDARRFLAHTLAFEFEQYAVACAQIISDAEPEGPDDGRVLSGMAPLPTAPSLPTSTAYQWMESELLERIFAFPQDVGVMRRSLEFMQDVVGGDEYGEEASKTTARFGLSAIAIASDLRKGNGIPPRVLASGRWNISKYLEARA